MKIVSGGRFAVGASINICFAPKNNLRQTKCEQRVQHVSLAKQSQTIFLFGICLKSLKCYREIFELITDIEQGFSLHN